MGMAGHGKEGFREAGGTLAGGRGAPDCGDGFSQEYAYAKT